MKKLTPPLALFLSLALILSTVAGGSPAVAAADTAGAGLSNPSIDSNGVTTWDCVYFGNYSKEGGNNKEPIKWRVLSVDGSNAFLMSDNVLDERQYAEIREDNSCTWETSDLRTWLNQDFYQNAFSQEEQAAILTGKVVNEDNADTGTDGGNDTEDKIYVLSVNEVCKAEYGFDTDPDKESKTRFAGEYGEDWWLRTPCEDDCQAIVNFAGSVSRKKEQYAPDNYLTRSVRPVLHLNLDKTSVWTKTDSVKSESSGETAAPTVAPTTKPDTTPKPTVAPTKKPTTTSNPTTTKKPAATAKPTATPVPKVTAVPRKPAPDTKMKPGEKKAISSFEDLKAMEDIPSGNYYLTKDITVSANTQLFWDYPFTGTLDGKGHKIKGFKVQKTFVIGQELTHDATAGEGWDLIVEEACAGVFYQASGATFKNLSLTKVNINVQTEDYATVGALVSQAEKCTFDNVHVSGKISVKSIRENPLRVTGFDIGGIVGKSKSDFYGKYGTFTNCSNSANITVYCKNSQYSYGANVGGLSGGEYSKMTKCTNSGNISLSGYGGSGTNGGMNVAGLVNVCDRISSCTNSGKVTLKVQAAGNNYETPVKMDRYEAPEPADKIQCFAGASAAGVANKTRCISSSGNTGKIQMSYKLKLIDWVQLAGVAGTVSREGKKCYNKGAVSYSGEGKSGEHEEVGIGGVFCRYDRTVTQCYNKGKVSFKADKPHSIGGVAAYSVGHVVEVTNCYNTGTIYSKTQGQVGGVVGYYDGGWKADDQKTEPRMKYNYNAGKITGYKKANAWGIGSVAGACGDCLMMMDKHAVYDNYSTGSFTLYGGGPSSKKLNPLGKKVSRITKANCPKLSSKYWVYSPKVKRLVLKNNNETKSVKKTKTKKTKKK